MYVCVQPEVCFGVTFGQYFEVNNDLGADNILGAYNGWGAWNEIHLVACF